MALSLLLGEPLAVSGDVVSTSDNKRKEDQRPQPESGGKVTAQPAQEKGKTAAPELVTSKPKKWRYTYEGPRVNGKKEGEGFEQYGNGDYF